MVMTFIFHPLSHYNSITKPCARFLLSFLEGLYVDFPFHFILSFIYVYRDTVIHDKLIFLSAITRILCHFFVSYPKSTHFSLMCAIDATTVRRSEAQLRSNRPRIETATPLASYTPSTSTPSSSAGGVTLKAIMAQLVHMNARLDTLNDELCQMNTHVGHIAQQQVVMGGFTITSSRSPPALEDESDDGSGSDDTDEDKDASSSSDDEMTA